MTERTDLIRERERLGLTRPKFAQRVGVTRNYIFCVEVGRRNPSLAMMVKWVKALGPGASLDLFGAPKKRKLTPRRQAERIEQRRVERRKEQPAA